MGWIGWQIQKAGRTVRQKGPAAGGTSSPLKGHFYLWPSKSAEGISKLSPVNALPDPWQPKMQWQVSSKDTTGTEKGQPGEVQAEGPCQHLAVRSVASTATTSCRRLSWGEHAVATTGRFKSLTRSCGSMVEEDRERLQLILNARCHHRSPEYFIHTDAGAPRSPNSGSLRWAPGMHFYSPSRHPGSTGKWSRAPGGCSDTG